MFDTDPLILSGTTIFARKGTTSDPTLSKEGQDILPNLHGKEQQTLELADLQSRRMADIAL